MLLAQALDDPELTGWMIGLGIGALVVAIVVVVVGLIIDAASRIERQAGEAIDALETTYSHTRPLWDVQTTNETLGTIVRQCQLARRRLEARR